MTSRLANEAITDSVGTLPISGDTITVSFTGAADNSTVLVRGKHYMMVATEDCHVIASATATADDATTSDFLLPAKTILDFEPDQELYVSVISAGTNGTLYIAPRTTGTA